MQSSVEILRQGGLDVQVWPLTPTPTGRPEALAERPLWAAAQGALELARLRRRITRALCPGDVIVAHWLPLGLALADRAPTLVWAHGSDVALLESLPAGRRMARHLDTTARALAFVSDDLRARFVALLGRPPRAPHWHLPMGITPAAPDSAFAAHLRHTAAGRPIIATVGRMVPLKGLDVLARALPEGAVWFAAGDGPERPRLQHMCPQLICLGVLDPPRRDALLSVADVFVQPSRPVGRRTEGTPVAVLEALQSGVPVVASALGGINELGVVTVPPDDPGALARALVQVLATPGPLPSIRRCSWEVAGADHLRAVQRLLQAPGRVSVVFRKAPV